MAIGVIYESLLCREEIAAQSEMDFKSIFGHYGYWSDSKSLTFKNQLQIKSVFEMNSESVASCPERLKISYDFAIIDIRCSF